MPTAILERPSEPEVELTAEQQKTVSAVMTWDLSRVTQYLTYKGIVHSEDVAILEQEYKRFIVLNLLNPDVIIPIAGSVDDIWHAHILFTRDYVAFCNTVNNGNYIHHNPTASDDERNELNSSYRSNTFGLYKKMFGDLDNSIWNEKSPVCRCSNNNVS